MRIKIPAIAWYIAGIVAVLAVLVVLSKQGVTAPAAVDPSVDARWSKGSDQAIVTLTEFADFQCPACSGYAPILDALHERYGDQVRIVFRHFPLSQIHRNAQIAGQAAEAAGAQGKFWEFGKMLFEKQSEWSSNTSPEEIFIRYADELALDVSRFTSDMNSVEMRGNVLADLALGNSLRVQGTPSFYLNGKAIQTPGSLEQFAAQIDTLLATAPIQPQNEAVLLAKPVVNQKVALRFHINGKTLDTPRIGKATPLVEAVGSTPGNTHGIFVTTREGVRLTYLLDTMGLSIANDCFTLPGESFCTNASSSLKVFIDGKRTIGRALETYELQPLDRILVSYGPLADKTLEAQIASVANETCILGGACNTASSTKK